MKRGKSNQGKRVREEKRLEKYNSEPIVDGKWIIVLSVVIVFAAFYSLTVYLTHSKTSKKANTEEETVSASEILLGRSFAMSDGEYLVLFYDSSKEEEASTCKELFSNYEGAHGEGSIYFVDMNRGFNKAHQTEEESNKTPSSAADLSINGPTLMKIQDKKSVEYIEGIDAITDYLNA